jgi:hypothetical protein
MATVQLAASSEMYHVQYITMPNEDMPFLRELHFPSTNVPVIRQVAPLPEPEQPDGGHRLIYYMLGGALRFSKKHRQQSQHHHVGHHRRALSKVA